MSGMAYYIVMAFFCALFIAAFSKSNLGALLAIEGAQLLKAMALPSSVTVVGIIFLTAFVNLFVGSSSAKWALLGTFEHNLCTFFLMQLGISPDLTQAAYRVGDSSSNIITPLMPYFPLVVVYCQKYVKGTGIGTLIAMMLPYSIAFLIGWSIFLLAYWGLLYDAPFLPRSKLRIPTCWAFARLISDSFPIGLTQPTIKKPQQSSVRLWI